MEKVSRLGLDLCLQTGNELFEEAIESGYDALEVPFEFNFKHSIHKRNDIKFHSLMVRAIVESMNVCKGEKIGIAFSGGVDSVILACLMKKLYPDEDIVAYFSNFGDPNMNELPYAQEAAEFIGIPLVVVDTGRYKQLAQVNEATKLCSTLTVGIVQMTILTKAMAEDGVKHVFWGHGGEFMGGLSMNQRYHNKDKGLRNKLRLYPLANTKVKWDRYVAILFGTDKAWILNKLLKAPSKRHVHDSDYNLKWIYNQIDDQDLWVKLRKWATLKTIGRTKSKIDCVRAYNMTPHFPFIDKQFADYCFGLSPEDIYSKKALREWMVSLGFSEFLSYRGYDFKVSSDSKAGLSPTDTFYDYEYVRFIVPVGYESNPVYIKYFTKYVKKNMLKWMKTADMRAIQIGLFLRMMEHRGDLDG